MRKTVIALFVAVCIQPLGISLVSAQTTADSIAIMNAKWEIKNAGAGIVSRCAAFTQLYNGPQYVSIVEINPQQKRHAGIGISKQMKRISQLARENKAIAAINGSYYNMRHGNSVCFLKVDNAVIDSTEEYEFNLRVTGAVRVRKGKLSIIPWTRALERTYKKHRGTVLASGPLMLQNGHYADWSECDEKFIETKHPRSAVAITHDKRILLITADGRSRDNAVGMSIPELAHLIKVLGGKTALNLDGGGSTSLYFNGEILNHPTDNRHFDHEGERSIPNIIYFR